MDARNCRRKIKINGGQLWRCHIDQLREREDTPKEHPLEDQPHITQEDAVVWSNSRSPSADTNQSDTNESVPEETADTQQPEVSDQPVTAATPTAATTSQTATDN